MCGILIWLNKHRQVDPARFSEALALLEHSGPDAQQMVYYDDWRPKPGARVWKLGEQQPTTPQLGAIGHTRLSILDLRQVAHQPLLSDDGRHCLVYNGEVYNYKEERIRHGLAEICRSHSDSEVLFRALIQEGASCLETMNGMWSFGFFDFERRELLLSRDPYGKKPLFIYHDESNFIASSEIKSIYKILSVTRRLNTKVLSGYLLGKLTPTFDDGQTIYEDIKFLPAGSNLRLDLRDLSYEITRDNDLGHWLSKPARLADFPEEVETAVNLRLRSDVPIAIPVSGGVDSTVVASYAHKNAKSQNDIRYFTILNYDHDGKPKADLEYARLLMKKLGADLTEIEIPVEETEVYEQFRHMIAHYEFTQNPFLISWPTYLLNKQMASAGIKVILDGTGGDEVLGGYPGGFQTVAENLATSRNLGQALGYWRLWDAYKQGPVSNRAKGYLRLLKLAILKGNNRTSIEERALLDFQPYLRGEIFQETCDDLVDNFFIRQCTKNIRDYQLFEIKNYLLPYALYVNDQCAMTWSMENRSPLLDINLLKYVNLPDSEKCRGGYNKHFLREAMPNSVPSAIRWRTNKMGMGISPRFFFQGKRKLIEESIMNSELASEVADLDAVRLDLKAGALPDTVLRGLFGVALLGQTFDCSLA